MTEMIKEWVTGVMCASAAVCVVSSIVPEAKMKNAVRFIGGLIVLLAFIKPLLEIGNVNFAPIISNYKIESEEYGRSFADANYSIMKEIIEADTAAYILDKAEELGIRNCTAAVSAEKGDDDYPYPCEVWISACATPVQRSELTESIETELGIDSKRQHWSDNSGD